MLEIRQVSHAFGPRMLLSHVSITLAPHDRVGVTGPNGSGKSTLLRIAAGDLVPDAGRVVARASTRVAALPQSVAAPPGLTVAARFPHLAAGPGPLALDLREVRAETPLSTLSGGELMRLAIADALAGQPDVLLLDEPTNHLDLAGMHWLETRLRAFGGAVLVVSHDPAFLDAAVERLIVLGAPDGRAEVFVGFYSAWLAERDRRAAEQRLAYGRQQREERRLREHLAQMESRSRHIEQSTINFAIRKKAKKIARRTTTMKRRLEREAAAAEHVERPSAPPRPFIDTTAPVSRTPARLVELDGVEVGAGGRVLLRGVTASVRSGDRIALIGDNGSGKSTLLRLLRDGERPARGTLRIAAAARLGSLGQEDAFEDRLDRLPVDVLRREGGMTEGHARQLLHRVLGPVAATGASLGDLSYGERRRLALTLLVAQGANVLLLDEPTNHLDLAAREAMTAALAGFGGAMVFATHDRALVAALGSEVWSIEDGRVVTRGLQRDPATGTGALIGA